MTDDRKTVERLSLREVEIMFRNAAARMDKGELKETDEEMRLIFTTYMAMRLLSASQTALAYYALADATSDPSDIGPSADEHGHTLMVRGMRARAVLAGIMAAFAGKLHASPRNEREPPKILIQ